MPLRNIQQLRKQPDLSKVTVESQCQNWISGVTHMRGWRKTMQDAHISQLNIDGKGTHLFAVFDGHGGGQVAIFAKNHLKQLLLQSPWFKNQQYIQALAQVFPNLDAYMMKDKGSNEVFQIKQHLDEQIAKQYPYDWQDDSDEETQCLAGSTAVCCLVTKQNVYVANVGDSQCIIAANNQRKVFYAEHTPNNADQKRRIQAVGGKVKNNRVNGLLSMSRSLGDFRFKTKKNRTRSEQMVICDPFIETIPNLNIQFIMLGCDGVWEGKDVNWHFNFVEKAKSKPPSKIIQRLFDEVVAQDSEDQDGHDNMTAILVVPKDKKKGI